MFMVGVAMPFAFAARTHVATPGAAQARHALRRAAMLVLDRRPARSRRRRAVQIGFIRVLQQIAVGYLAAFLVLGQVAAHAGGSSSRPSSWLSGALDVQPLERARRPLGEGNENIGSAFDFWMLGRHYSGYYVGMNAIPSTATIIFGVMAGQHVLASRDARRTSPDAAAGRSGRDRRRAGA